MNALISQFELGNISQQLDATESNAVLVYHTPEWLQDYERKLAIRLETVSGDVIYASRDWLNSQKIQYTDGISELQQGDSYWYVFGATNLKSGLRMLVLQEDDFRAELRGDLTIDTLVPILLMLPVIIWLGWWSVNFNFASFQRLAKTIRSKPSDNYEQLSGFDDTEEVAVISRSLNHYLSRVEQSFAREKRFSSDAAHELRTPVANLKLRIQNLIDSSSNVQKQTLEPLMASVNQLIRLIDNLLLLSRTERQMNSTVPLKLARQVREVVALWYEKAEQKEQTFELRLDDTATVHSDPDLLHILLSNLVDNAIKYGALGSVITIEQRKQALAITNQVSEQTQFDIARVSERFYRGGHLDIDGTGLGLSIVGNIAEQLDIRVQFSRDESAFICTLSF
ncbi:hypothetical protein BFR57_07610 [Idiomarina sp. MD25a]|nr:hypothetical protein BFR57_07610 [Idiomarina sp. MD25a]